MIANFKLFESEIYVGTHKHYNRLKPVNVEVIEDFYSILLLDISSILSLINF